MVFTLDEDGHLLFTIMTKILVQTIVNSKKNAPHARIKICFQRGPTLTNFFIVDEGREDPNSTKSGPSSARQRSAI